MRKKYTSSPNVQDEPRPQPARLVLLGARDVTDVVVGSGALLGCLAFMASEASSNRADILSDEQAPNAWLQMPPQSERAAQT